MMCTSQKLKVTNANVAFSGVFWGLAEVESFEPFQPHTICGHSPQKKLSFATSIGQSKKQPDSITLTF